MKGTLATTILCLSRTRHLLKPDHDCKHIVSKQYQTQANCRVTSSKSTQLVLHTCSGTRINMLSANFCCQQSTSFTCQDAE
ncbi:hypothetical protein DPMN_158272 [Dreissena polymorpha]|uniref:Uncharacterized protein n=1 Tax=Dreissena polymorpha TaxID=45954 RepID=A0A9D4IPM4_DREPO|nr:hypothetical protein DPMN_158272 [Dreissena polymorpha]